MPDSTGTPPVTTTINADSGYQETTESATYLSEHSTLSMDDGCISTDDITQEPSWGNQDEFAERYECLLARYEAGGPAMANHAENTKKMVSSVEKKWKEYDTVSLVH